MAEGIDGTLREGLEALVRLQRSFDVDNFNGAAAGDVMAKRRHVGFHVTILAAKLARLEERSDHSAEADDVVLRTEVIPDLLVYAAQLADLAGVDLADAYLGRLDRLRGPVD